MSLSPTVSVKIINKKWPIILMRYNEVIQLKETGLSYAEIGLRLGISREQVRQIVIGKPRRVSQRKDMLSVGDVSQLLGVHPNTARHWSEMGILKSYRIGPRRDRRFRLEDIEDFLLKDLEQLITKGGQINETSKANNSQ